MKKGWKPFSPQKKLVQDSEENEVDLDMNPHSYTHLTFDKGAKNI
jgi:hypothetical protein